MLLALIDILLAGRLALQDYPSAHVRPLVEIPVTLTIVWIPLRTRKNLLRTKGE
jgi:hypothetical protein